MEITPANQIKCNVSRKEIVSMFCEKLMDKINSAAQEGYHKTCFYYSSITIGERRYLFDEFQDDIKAKFLSAGYTIKPTGYIGGVWQRTEDICW